MFSFKYVWFILFNKMPFKSRGLNLYRYKAFAFWIYWLQMAFHICRILYTALKENFRMLKYLPSNTCIHLQLNLPINFTYSWNYKTQKPYVKNILSKMLPIRANTIKSLFMKIYVFMSYLSQLLDSGWFQPDNGLKQLYWQLSLNQWIQKLLQKIALDFENRYLLPPNACIEIQRVYCKLQVWQSHLKCNGYSIGLKLNCLMRLSYCPNIDGVTLEMLDDFQCLFCHIFH